MTLTSIYLNACSHGLPSEGTLNRMIHHINAETARGPVVAARECTDEVELGFARAAELLGFPGMRAGWCHGTSAIWQSIMNRHARKPGRILVSACEWGDNVRHVQSVLHPRGIVLDTVPMSEAFDPAAWAARLDEDVLAVSLPLVTSIEGLTLPIARIANLPRPDGTLVVLDAAQGVGRVPIPAGAFGCDAVIATARKWLRAPRQCAIFVLSNRAQRILETSTAALEPLDRNTTLQLGMAQALAELRDAGLSSVVERIGSLDETLRTGLQEVGITPMIHPRQTVGTVAMRVTTDQRARLSPALATAGILVKWCDASRDEPLAGHDPSSEVLRLSPHIYLSNDDIRAVAAALAPT